MQNDSCVVDAFNANGGREMKSLMRVPTSGKDAVAVGYLQSIGHLTLAFMDGDAIVLVEVSKDVVARNRMTALAHDVVVNGFLIKDDGALAVDWCLWRRY